MVAFVVCLLVCSGTKKTLVNRPSRCRAGITHEFHVKIMTYLKYNFIPIKITFVKYIRAIFMVIIMYIVLVMKNSSSKNYKE